MSDEIFEIASHSVDVAALGQDYSDRVDGERILLALPQPLSIGDEVRFVVLLLDGTPAFAGAGRCIQVSDQGGEAGEARYETLIDSLAFDERSAPVYEYIVQVRQLAYQQNPDAGEGPGDIGRVSADGGDVDVAVSDAPEEAAWDDADATRVSRGSIPAEALRMLKGMEKHDLDGATMEMRSMHAAAQNNRQTPVADAPVTARPARAGRSELPEAYEPDSLHMSNQQSQQQGGVALPTYATVPPEPLKTGILTRPAIAAHWAPAAPRPPSRSLRPTGFQSQPGPLAVPTVPPRPALDRSQWVERAPAPQ